ncbi:MAG: chromosomal replication initiator protein DnaA [bacterium]|nr:chromosomal replication initiator protein DnaA [bacterium]
MDSQEAWHIAYNQLQLQLDRASFDTWLRGATLIQVEETGTFVIGVRNTYAREMLQNRLYRNIRRVLMDVLGEAVELRFEVRQTTPESKKPREEMPLFKLLAEQGPVEAPPLPLHEQIARPQRPALPESELNARFVFDRFVVNGSNRLAYEAARAVAENPAKYYNPLLLYGSVGLGKTHLLHAIAHTCRAHGLRVIYVPSEAFTNDLVDSIRHKTTAMFRERYRSVDVLLVDDVQFMAGKESTQEEFFHTFNALYTFNKQIVLVSDRPPRELNSLEDRLRSRFEGGLAVDVQPLELESRLAILEMWARERGVILPMDAMQAIAERARSNVRELEGLFNQAITKAHLEQRPVTMQVVEAALERHERPRQHRIRKGVTMDQVIEAVAAHFDLYPEDITGKGRSTRLNQARQVAMFLVRELTDVPLVQIGDVFGGRSHTTVLHGCNKMAEEMERDAELRALLMQLRAQLRGA